MFSQPAGGAGLPCACQPGRYQILNGEWERRTEDRSDVARTGLVSGCALYHPMTSGVHVGASHRDPLLGLQRAAVFKTLIFDGVLAAIQYCCKLCWPIAMTVVQRQTPRDADYTGLGIEAPSSDREGREGGRPEPSPCLFTHRSASSISIPLFPPSHPTSWRKAMRIESRGPVLPRREIGQIMFLIAGI